MRFNFVVGRSEAEIARLVRCYDDIDAAVATTDIFSNGELCWCLQTYVLLARRGHLDVSCTNRLDPAAVNLVHSDRLLMMRPDPHAFAVCIRADYPKRQWARHHIVQNHNQAGPAASYVPHWPQPGLRQRDPRRRGVRSVAYVGQVGGNLAGSVERWRAMFAPHGIAFLVPPRERWHDMSETDVLIAIRSFDHNPHRTKPATKLFNAWHAHVPFIGGHDSSYVQVANPGRDYFVASSPDEVLCLVLRLAEDPLLYTTVVANGDRMAQRYTFDTIAAHWEALLDGQIKRHYAKWRSSWLSPVTFAFGVAAGLCLHHARRVGRQTINAIRRGESANVGA